MDSSPYSTTSEIFAVGGEDYLKEGHTPTTLPERRDEILRLRRSLKPAARGAGAENTFLSGKAGQGKTAAAKAELAELEAFAETQGLDLTTVFSPVRASLRLIRLHVVFVKNSVVRTPMDIRCRKYSIISGTR
jgi:Cdc6-like AAA superfamily ATPase